ncbi:hypothetical protein FJZ40_03865 [Candidatus Shapirobacteria bacterium]|nr:hypothetical protein [Candidatus Shapirobacteria bacterium]
MAKKNLFKDWKKYWPFLLVFLLIILGIFSGKSIFRYYFFSTHDGDRHIARSFDAIAALSEGHFPLRWAGSLNHYCGVPVFNFFYPLIYYLVFLLNFLTYDVILSLKIIYLSTFVLAPIFFYFWLAKETNNHIASFTGALLYLFVPYRFLLIFVRSSPEFISYTILPLLLYLISSIFEDKIEGKKLFPKSFLIVVVGGLLTISHNFAAMFLLPIILLFIFSKLVFLKLINIKKVFFIVFVFLSFFGLGAFFIGPAFLEKSTVKLATVQTINYKEHFPALWQLVRSPWGYFYSSSGTENDGMSFMLGYAQWLVLALSGIFLLKNFKDERSKRRWFLGNFFVILWFLLSLLTIFLILPYSISIWDRVRILQQVQFSWRFLGVTSFTIAALAGALLSKINSRFISGVVVLGFIFFAIYGNRNHLLPQPVSNIEQYYHFEALHPNRYSTTTLADDILSKNALAACGYEPFLVFNLARYGQSYSEKAEAGNQADVFVPFLHYGERVRFTNQEKIDYTVDRKNSYGAVFFSIPGELSGNLRINLEFFPGTYKFSLNGNKIGSYSDCSGRVCLENLGLRKGKNTINWKIVQTPTQKIFNLISILFLFTWLALFIGNFLFKKNDRS